MEENQFANGMQLLKSKKLPLVIRGGYKYNIQLTTDERGRIINVQSVAGKTLRIGHEIVFVGSDGAKKPFTFLENEEKGYEGNIPLSQNVIQVDDETMKWFQVTAINNIYIRNTDDRLMYKFPVEPNRRTEFKIMAKCFNEALDGNSVKNVEIEAPKPGTTAKPTGRTLASTENMSDAEFEALKGDLDALKAALRQEIALERDRAARTKQDIQEDVLQQRRAAENKKAEYAKEVLAARQRSSEEISKSKLFTA